MGFVIGCGVLFVAGLAVIGWSALSELLHGLGEGMVEDDQ